MTMNPSNRIRHVEEYYFSSKLAQIAAMNKSGSPVLNLGIGSPDMSPPKEVIDTLISESLRQDVHGYQSYRGLPALRNAFAKYYKDQLSVSLDPEGEILPLMGSKEGIMHIAMSFLNEGDKVLVPNPGYPSYAATTKLAGGEPVFYNLDEHQNWQPDFEHLASLNPKEVKMMWINYPNMPTGAKPDLDVCKRLIEFCTKNQILLCHDNPYNHILNDRPTSIFAIDGSKHCCLELASLSKCYNMAGWRVGAIIGSDEHIKMVLRFKSNMDSGMFKPIQLAAAKALTFGSDWFESMNNVYRERQKAAQQIMDLLDCTYDIESSGLFVWAKAPNYIKDVEAWIEDILIKARVFITPGFIFGSNGQRYIRISLCNELDAYQLAFKKIDNYFIKSIAAV